jgi:hypothetical protein
MSRMALFALFVIHICVFSNWMKIYGSGCKSMDFCTNINVRSLIADSLGVKLRNSHHWHYMPWECRVGMPNACCYNQANRICCWHGIMCCVQDGSRSVAMSIR